MAKSVDTLIAEISSGVHRLLYAEVIEHTIIVMRELQAGLAQLDGAIRGPDSLTDQQKEELPKILLPLTSESIREALHKGELHITNGIIRSKNRILTTLGVPIPEDHREIDAKDFPNYNW
jgi:hypothetical protein